MAKDASMRVLDERPPSEVVHQEIEQLEKGRRGMLPHGERGSFKRDENRHFGRSSLDSSPRYDSELKAPSSAFHASHSKSSWKGIELERRVAASVGRLERTEQKILTRSARS